MQSIDELMAQAQKQLHDEQKAEQALREKEAAESTPIKNKENIYADMIAEMGDESESMEMPEEITIRHQPYDSEIPYEDDYVIDADDPIFPGGPGRSQVELWKKEYSRETVMHTKILEKHYVFRTLNRFEYKQIVAIDKIDALYREELICQTCVLWPLNYDFKRMAIEDSGYPSTLAQIIMENSGFSKNYGIEVL